MTPTVHPDVPGASGATSIPLAVQTERLIELGVPGLAGISDDEFLAHADALAGADAQAGAAGQPGEAAQSEETAQSGGSFARLLAVHPSLVPVARLAELMTREGRAGFVVVDMVDLADFTPIDDITSTAGFSVPDAPLYLVGDVTRGDDLLGWTPDDAGPELAARGRTPLTISEGVSWLLQQPEVLEPGACFMCIGSRKRKAGPAAGRRAAAGLDARTPALWISGGTGRDGRENKGAPKLGWCWAGNHHTWLGFASASGRRGPG